MNESIYELKVGQKVYATSQDEGSLEVVGTITEFHGKEHDLTANVKPEQVWLDGQFYELDNPKLGLDANPEGVYFFWVDEITPYLADLKANDIDLYERVLWLVANVPDLHYVRPHRLLYVLASVGADVVTENTNYFSGSHIG